MSGEIHGGGHGHGGHGHGDHIAGGGGGGAPAGFIPPDGAAQHAEARRRLHEEQVEQNRDVQESATDPTGQKEDSHHIAHGFRYATLSHQQLEGADSKNPIPTDPKGHVLLNNPPPGPGGTGNPFFSPNPMTTFFEVFTMLDQLMGYLMKVAAKLTVIDMEATKDTGLAAANATLQAGEAAAKSDFTQGILSIIQGVVTVGMLASSVATDVKLGKAGEESALEGEEEASNLSKQASEQEYDADEADAKLAAEKDASKDAGIPRMKATGPKGEELTPEAQEKQIENHKIDLKNQRKKAEKEYDEAMQNFQNSRVQMNKRKSTYNKDREDFQLKTKELETARQNRYKAIKEDEYEGFRDEVPQGLTKEESDLMHNPAKRAELNRTNPAKENELKAKEKAYQEHQKSMQRDSLEVNRLKMASRKMRQKADEAYKNAGEYRMSGTNLRAWERRANIKQQDPWFNRIQLGGQAINQFLQAGQSFAKGVGEEQQAYWQSYGQIMQTYNQMIKTGLDAAVKMESDAYQQGGELSQTLMKMSDQESQSMHWAA